MEEEKWDEIQGKKRRRKKTKGKSKEAGLEGKEIKEE